MRQILGTDLEVSPLCLGGNTFGWTTDDPQSFAVLDAFLDAGGNFIDSADVYSGKLFGAAEGAYSDYSEAVIGRWLALRGNRDDVVIATKVGANGGLGAEAIKHAAKTSLQRLCTDRIDLYYAHVDDESTPLEETLGAFDELVREGLVRYVAASNYSPPRLAEALATSDREGFARYVALQPHYNLMRREIYEGDLQAVCTREGVSCIPFFGLAYGFLTGKYRPDSARVASVRAERARAYLDERGIAVLDALDEVAAGHATSVAAVALAWLAAQPMVTSPIASARTPEQLAELIQIASLDLSASELERLGSASSS